MIGEIAPDLVQSKTIYIVAPFHDALEAAPEGRICGQGEVVPPPYKRGPQPLLCQDRDQGTKSATGAAWGFSVRIRLPDRRRSTTIEVEAVLDNNHRQKLIVTVGFGDDGRPMEVFCASFRAGTAMNFIVMDACILISRLLQHGDDPRDILQTLRSDTLSLIGVIAEAVSKFTSSGGHDLVRHHEPDPHRDEQPPPR